MLQCFKMSALLASLYLIFGLSPSAYSIEKRESVVGYADSLHIEICEQIIKSANNVAGADLVRVAHELGTAGSGVVSIPLPNLDRALTQKASSNLIEAATETFPGRFDYTLIFYQGRSASIIDSYLEAAASSVAAILNRALSAHRSEVDLSWFPAAVTVTNTKLRSEAKSNSGWHYDAQGIQMRALLTLEGPATQYVLTEHEFSYRETPSEEYTVLSAPVREIFFMRNGPVENSEKKFHIYHRAPPLKAHEQRFYLQFEPIATTTKQIEAYKRQFKPAKNDF